MTKRIRVFPEKKTYSLSLTNQGQQEKVLYFFKAEKGQAYRTTFTVHHGAEDTESDIEIRGVVQNGSRVHLSASLTGAEIKHAHAKLVIRILLTGTRLMYSEFIPKIQVKGLMSADHGVSLSRVDETILLYVQSRGLTQQQAVGLVTEAFLSSPTPVTST